MSQGEDDGSFFRRGAEFPPAGSADDDGAFRKGQVLGDYRLERPLKSGGMGQVWVAHQISLDRPVALKLLLGGVALTESQMARMENEAKAGGRLDHPCIASVFAWGAVEGVPFIAQQLIGDGWSLADELHEVRRHDELPEAWYRHVAEFFARAAEALQVAHDAQVVHRDLKPQNILIEADDRPVIVDFGLADVSGHETILLSGQFAGTIAYMSPEQALTKRIEIDHRTDIFSLGATLYEALTLQQAFDGDSVPQITEKIVLVDPPEPRKVRSLVPRDLAVICMKAIEKRQVQRYASMQELAADLRRWLRGESIVARPVGVVTRGVKWMRRHPVVSVVTASTLLLLVVLGYAVDNYANQIRRERASTTRIEMLSEDLTDESSRLRVALGASERRLGRALVREARAAVERDDFATSRVLLAEVPQTERAWEWRRTQLLTDNSIKPHTIQGRCDEELLLGTSVAIGRDGRFVYYTDGGELFRLDFLGGEECSLPGGQGLVYFELSSDGTRIATLSTSGVRLITVDGQVLGEYSTSSGLNYMKYHCSPMAWESGGRRLVVDSGDGELAVLDGWTAAVLSILSIDAHSSVNGIEWEPTGESLLIVGDDGSVLQCWTQTGASDYISFQDYSVSGRRGVSSVCWSGDGMSFVLGFADGSIQQWRKKGGRESSAALVHDFRPSLNLGEVLSLKYNADSSRVAVLYEGAEAQIRDADTLGLVQALNQWNNQSFSIAWDYSGQLLATAGRRSSHLWGAETGDVLSELSGRSSMIAASGWAPDGSSFVALGMNGDLRAWSRFSGTSWLELPGGAWLKGFEWENDVAWRWSPDGDVFASASEKGAVSLWDSRDGRQKWFHDLDEASSLRDSFSTLHLPELSWIAGGHEVALLMPDGLRVLNAETGSVARHLVFDGKSARSCSQSPVDALFLVQYFDRVEIRDAIAGTVARKFDSGAGSMSRFLGTSGATWGPGGARVAWTDGTDLVISDVFKDADSSIELPGISWGGAEIAWSPDGRFVCVSTGSSKVELIEAEGAEHVRSIETSHPGIKAMAWSHDGSRLAVGSSDGEVSLWDTVSWSRRETLRQHGYITSVQWAPGDAVLAVSDDSGRSALTIWFRDLETARPYWREAERRRRAAAAESAISDDR